MSSAVRSCLSSATSRVVGQVFYNRLLRFSTSQIHQHKESLETQSVPEEDTTHYGFETVKKSEKAKKVREVFEAVASKYDLMNDAMSGGIHRVWKDHFVSKITPIRNGTQILDVAGGTGDIAFRLADHIRRQAAGLDDIESRLVVSDINQAMLDVGQKRASDKGFELSYMSWLCADAQNLPLEDNSFDLYTIAFGIRNVTDVQKALDEAYRVLRPGGRFMCLEFSHVENDALRWAYDKYSFQVIPPLGELLAGDWKSYQYLVESIRKFPKQEEFKYMIEESGFRSVAYENMTFGVVAIHSAFKI